MIKTLISFLLFTLPAATLAMPHLGGCTGPDAFQKNRKQMVDVQLKGRGINNTDVLRAMAVVPRHLFVSKYLRRRAYDDGPLPIGHGQTISQPFIVAYMSQIIRLKPGQRVLEIGTGSGYQAAILAQLTDHVYTMEIVPSLAESAAKRLKELGYHTINTRQGDGYNGWPEAAPFDAIVVTAAAEFIPPPLIRQLKEGGRMIIPVGSPFFVQHLLLVTKNKGTITTQNLMPVRFVPFRRSR